MVELSLEGWTAAQRERLGFLIDDARIDAEWHPNTISVPDEAAPQVQRFIKFLAAPDESVIGVHTVAAPITSGADTPTAADPDLDAPRMPFTDDPGVSDVATPGLRLGGALIDYLVIGLAAIPVFLATGPAGPWVQLFVVAVYEIGMVGLGGRTLGNMAVRTRVVSIDDRGVPGVPTAFVRWLVPQAAVFVSLVFSWPDTITMAWALIVFLPILIPPSYRGLHDRAAGVMVLDDRRTPATKVTPPQSTQPQSPNPD